MVLHTYASLSSVHAHDTHMRDKTWPLKSPSHPHAHSPISSSEKQWPAPTCRVPVATPCF